MDGMVEENGTSTGAGPADPLGSASSSAPASAPHVVAVTSIVQLTLPTQAPSAQVFILLFIYLHTFELNICLQCSCVITVTLTCVLIGY